MLKKIDLGEDFSTTPGGRYKADGKFSGEEFREKFLVPALNNGDHISVDLDNVLGVCSGFLEEAFGGLVRIYGPSIVHRVTVVSTFGRRDERAMDMMTRAVGHYGK